MRKSTVPSVSLQKEFPANTIVMKISCFIYSMRRAQSYKTINFRNLLMFVIGYSVCPWPSLQCTLSHGIAQQSIVNYESLM